jgi:predicted amino acid dehydrogenase
MKKFAFLIHPRTSAREDMGRVSRVFFCFPEIILQKLTPIFDPIPAGKITFLGTKEVIGWIIVVPLLGKHFFSFPREFVVKKIIKAIELAKKLGANVVGLGALTSPVTHGGEDLIGKIKNITITNGNSLTAAVVVKAVKRISEIKKIDLSKEKIAVIGAGGSVGKGSSLLLAEHKFLLILIDKKEKIDELKKDFSSFLSTGNIVISDEISLIKEAEIVIVATSSADQIIKSDYLKEGAIVYDITQPKNTHPNILKERKDVMIIDGGVIDTPKIDYGMDIGLKEHQAYACLVETMICALEGIEENYVGYTKLENAKKMLNLMEKYHDYFEINIFQSFGKPLNDKLEPID